MTRPAVAKHLRLLEDAGLIATRRHGREKLHYLNPVPIRLLHDRWTTKYTEAWAADLVDLKHDLEATVEKVSRSTSSQPGAALAGDHRSGDPGTLPVRCAHRVGTGRPGRATTSPMPEGLARSSRARTSRSTRRDGLCSPSPAVWDDDIAAEGTSRVTWEIRTGRRLMPVHRHPRPAARGRRRAPLRRLADDPVRAQDLARDRSRTDHPRLTHVPNSAMTTLDTDVHGSAATQPQQGRQDPRRDARLGRVLRHPRQCRMADPFQGLFMALGNGTDKLAVPAAVPAQMARTSATPSPSTSTNASHPPREGVTDHPDQHRNHRHPHRQHPRRRPRRRAALLRRHARLHRPA